MTNKAQIRTEFLAKRKALTPQEILEANEGICQLFFNEIFNNNTKSLHTFLPILKNNEPNTWLIINELKDVFGVIVPKVVGGGELEHYGLTPPPAPPLSGEGSLLRSPSPERRGGWGERLSENRWGILEPTNGQKIENINEILDQNSIVLVPLLAFDKLGHRVGYGKGFYDRFLSQIEAKKIGLSFFEPVEKIEDTNPFDVKLDVCITPKKVWIFNEKNK